MKTIKLFLIISIPFLYFSCKQTKKTDNAQKPSYEIGSFGHDLEILNGVDDLAILSDSNAMIAVSGKYQGRIFTSTSRGLTGKSYGVFNKDVLRDSNWKQNLSKLGGEGRMWFGPEIGKYAIFFAPGTEQTPYTIKVSPELNTAHFNLIQKNDMSVTYGNNMIIRNSNNFHFQFHAKRRLSLLDQKQISKDLGLHINNKLSVVGFSAETTIRNTDKKQWKKEMGLLSIWDIACITPTPKTSVIIPLSNKTDSITNYFTPIDENRLRITDKVVIYKADAAYMNKIGIQPALCKNIFGSYSPEINLLTIVKYNFTKDGQYVNSLWGHKEPYQGDVINVFNGEVNDSLDRNWPFYELETSSAAKELKPNEEMYHKQSIYHFEGDETLLNTIAYKVLGVKLSDVSFKTGNK